MLFFRLEPGEGIDPYLGAWGHLLAQSDDLIDSIHEHPIYANGGPEIQFNVFFPREDTYKAGAVSTERRGEYRSLCYSGQRASVTLKSDGPRRQRRVIGGTFRGHIPVTAYFRPAAINVNAVTPSIAPSEDGSEGRNKQFKMMGAVRYAGQCQKPIRIG